MIEPYHIGWVSAEIALIMPKDEIKDVEILAFKSDDAELDGSYIVRVHKQTPTIEMVCADKAEAEEMFDFFNKSKKVIQLKERFKNSEVENGNK